ncbi:DnaJ domain containing protein [Tritrichomonas foetus]|uniref:DnaJ domain containing protein n=1 Tax=Tritrichomonas foetus TaxID=1144522 RepID=A0A1J4JRV2_9EUKA|nr:DnaJ domain containing protein [Tritrichomonas foetus]|eukprot:OHT01482.1 DnaJ domain containing protein [Tritrichomonas foetus]
MAHLCYLATSIKKVTKMFVFTLLLLITQTGNRDFYHILNVTNDASKRVIEKSFMRLSRKYHPDKNKGDSHAAEKFTDINDAYAVLRDANKRRIYDIYGERGVHLYEAPKNADAFMLNPNQEEDSLTQNVRRVGQTNRINFPVDLLDFYEGRAYPLSLTRRTMCRCPHKGFKCTKCRGRPTMRENVNLSLIVERGSEDRSVVLFKGAGDVSEINAPCDIEVVVFARKHPLFQRKGDDLHMTIDVALKEALLGFNKEYKHIDGSTFQVSYHGANIGNHTVVVEGKGMPKYLAPGEFGDVVAHLRVLQPKSLSQEQRTKLSDALKE